MAREVCVECDGDGWVYDADDGGTKTCPVCDGVEHDERDPDDE